MANYKKLTDVEVMEEVSENSMALVNENGVLKQVPCGAGFGGGTAAIIEFTGSAASEVGAQGDSSMSFICNNMTHSDILTSLQDGIFVNVVAIGLLDGVTCQGIACTMQVVPPLDNAIVLSFMYMPFETLFWYSDNTITTEEPGGGAE